MSAPIEFDRIHRSFAGESVLSGLSLSVQPGEVYALLGRNGSGKTTALRILLGMLQPMAGRSAILGVDSGALDGALRERIGYVGEGHQLEHSRTVKRTLDYEQATRGRFDRAAAAARLGDLGVPLKQSVKKLSRGQRAQLALVLALAGRPEVLVFDDPGLGLDVVMRRELLDAMIDLLAEGGTTVLFSTHVMADVERLADRVGVLHQGSLLVDASVDDLRTRVTRRFVRPARADGSAAFDGTRVPRLLAARTLPDGVEVTLLDAAEDQLQLLSAQGRVSDPTPLSLEDLFVALTAAEGPRGSFHATGAALSRAPEPALEISS